MLHSEDGFDYSDQSERLRNLCGQWREITEQARRLTREFRVPEEVEELPWLPKPPGQRPDDHGPPFAELYEMLEGISARIGEPVRVAMMGPFSAGKSSFINRLLESTYQPDPVPAHVHRATALIACTDTVAVLGHPVQVVDGSPIDSTRIDFVEVDRDLFRDINIIDTPGRDDSHMHDEVVADFMAHVDEIFFLVPAVMAGREDDVDFLAAKARLLPDTPIRYLITHCEGYLVRGGELNENQFEEVVNAMNRKIGNVLEERLDDLPRNERQRRYMNMRLTPRRNTFVIDNESGYGLSEFFGNELQRLASPDARRHKLQILRQQLNEFSDQWVDRFRELHQTIAKWHKWVKDYNDRIFDHEAKELERMVEEGIRHSIWRIDSAIRGIRGDDGTIQRDTLFEGVDKLERSRRSPDSLVPARFPDVEISAITQKLDALNEQIETAEVKTELFLSAERFRVQMYRLENNWKDVERERLKTGGAAAPPFTTCRVEKDAPYTQFVTEDGKRIHAMLERRIQNLLAIFGSANDEVNDEDISVLKKFEADVDYGFDWLSRHCEEMVETAKEWGTGHRTLLSEVYGSIEVPLRRVSDNVMRDVEHVFQRQIIEPLWTLRDFLDVTEFGMKKVQEQLSRLKEQLVGYCLDQLREQRERLENDVDASVEEFIRFVQDTDDKLKAERRRLQSDLDGFTKRAHELFEGVQLPQSPDFSELANRYVLETATLNESLRECDQRFFETIQASKTREQNAVQQSRDKQREQVELIQQTKGKELEALAQWVDEQQKEAESVADRERVQVTEKTRGAILTDVSLAVAVTGVAGATVALLLEPAAAWIGIVILLSAVHVANRLHARLATRRTRIEAILQDRQRNIEMIERQVEESEKNIQEKGQREREQLTRNGDLERKQIQTTEEVKRSHAAETALKEMGHVFTVFEDRIQEAFVKENAARSKDVLEAFVAAQGVLAVACDEHLQPLTDGIRRELESIYSHQLEAVYEKMRELTERHVRDFGKSIARISSNAHELLQEPMVDRVQQLMQDLKEQIVQQERRNESVWMRYEQLAQRSEQLRDETQQQT